MFRIFGWKIVGSFPSNLNKFVIAVGPHTSNWDFVVGIAARSVLKLTKAKFLGKSQLFKPPYGWLFRSLGGYPVDRSKSQDMVEQVAGAIKASEDFMLALAPEGTRKKVSTLKTGFYFIAKAANVPIIPAGFDFESKSIVIGNPIYPSDFETDMKQIITFFSKIKGRNPEWGIDETFKVPAR